MHTLSLTIYAGINHAVNAAYSWLIDHEAAFRSMLKLSAISLNNVRPN